MAGKVYEIAFKLAGQLSGDFASTFKAASNAMKGFSGELNKLYSQASQVDNIIKMRKEVMEAGGAYFQAKKRVDELNTVIRNTQQPTKALVAEFNRAKAAADKAKNAFEGKRESLYALEKAAGTTGQSLKTLTQRHKELEAAADRARAVHERFNNTLKGVRGSIDGMKAAAPYAAMTGAAMGAGLGAAINAGMKFETSMANVAAVSQASTDDLAKLTAQAKQLGADTEWSASQAAEGMTYLAMAGFKTEDTLKAMPGMLSLATAGSIDLGRAADISSNILTGFGLEAGEMGRVGDVLTNAFTSSNTTLEMLGQTMKYAAPVAKNMGVSIEEAAGMAAKLGDAGIQGEMAGTTLRAVLLRLSAPSKAGADAMDALGVATTDAAGNMRAYPDILADLQKSMSKLSQEERSNYTKAIFETEAMSGALVLMEQAGKGALQPYIDSLKKSGSAAEVAKGKQNTLAGDIKALQSKVEAVSIAIYDSIVPSLRAMAQSATGVLSSLTKWATENQGLVKTLTLVAGGIAAASAAAFPLMMIWKTMQFYGNALRLVGNGIALAFQKQTYALIANKAGMVAHAVVMGASKAVMLAVTVAQWALNTAFWACPITWIIAAIVALIAIGILLWKNWDKIKAKTVELWQSFNEKFPMMSRIVKIAMLPIKIQIQAVIIIFKLLKATCIALWNGIKWCWDAIKNYTISVWSWVFDILGDAWEKFKAFGAYIIGPFVSLWQGMRDKIGGIFSGLIDVVKGPFNAVIALVNKAIGYINEISIDIPAWAGGGKIGFDIAPIPALAKGGIATKPTLAMIGEGREDEAVLPLSKLNSMIGGGAGGGITVNFAPVINVSGGGADAYANVKSGLEEGARNLKRELQKLLADQRRLSYA